MLDPAGIDLLNEWQVGYDIHWQTHEDPQSMLAESVNELQEVGVLSI